MRYSFLSLGGIKNTGFQKFRRLKKGKVINMKKKVLIILICLIALLTGCAGASQINRRAFVQLLGIERDEDIYKATLQLYNNGNLGQNQEDENKTYDIITGTGATVQEAVSDAGLKQGKDLFLGHVKLLVIGKGLSNPADELLVLLKGNNVSPACPVIYSDSPEEAARRNGSEETLALLDGRAIRGKTTLTRLSSLYADIKAGGASSPIPEVIADDENGLSFGGLALVGKDGIKNGFPSEDILGLRILNGDIGPKDRIYIPAGINEAPVTVMITGCKTQNSIDIENNAPVINSEITVSIRITENPFGADSALISEKISENLKDACISAYSSAIWYNKSDILKIYKMIRKYRPDYADFYLSDSDSALEGSILNVNVNMKLENK